MLRGPVESVWLEVRKSRNMLEKNITYLKPCAVPDLGKYAPLISKCQNAGLIRQASHYWDRRYAVLVYDITGYESKTKETYKSD